MGKGDPTMIITLIGIILLIYGHTTPIGLLVIAILDFIQDIIITAKIKD